MFLLYFDLDEIDGAADYVEGFAKITTLRCHLSGTKLNCRWLEKRKVVAWHLGIR